MAGIRGKAARLVESSGFMGRVRELLRAAAAVHAYETPARAAGGMTYVHLACTAYLTHMHTGDRSAPAIDADGVLHAWCGAHLLRHLKDLYDFEPGKQDWPTQMATLLIEAATPRALPAGTGKRH